MSFPFPPLLGSLFAHESNDPLSRSRARFFPPLSSFRIGFRKVKCFDYSPPPLREGGENGIIRISYATIRTHVVQRICRICFQSHQEEDLSDPDLQDEESGEELPQQPLQGNTHSSTDSASAQAGTPTPLTHLNSLMGAHHPHFLAKLKMEVS